MRLALVDKDSERCVCVCVCTCVCVCVCVCACVCLSVCNILLLLCLFLWYNLSSLWHCAIDVYMYNIHMALYNNNYYFVHNYTHITLLSV